MNLNDSGATNAPAEGWPFDLHGFADSVAGISATGKMPIIEAKSDADHQSQRDVSVFFQALRPNADDQQEVAHDCDRRFRDREQAKRLWPVPPRLQQ